MRIILAIILALGTALLAFPQDGDASPLTAEQRRLNLESLEKVWSTVRNTHWDPTLGGVDWNAAHAAALSKVRSARNMQQSRAAMSEMLAKLKQSHFAIIPSDHGQKRGRQKRHHVLAYVRAHMEELRPTL